MGFAWRNAGSGSEWSTAQFQRAREAADAGGREALLRAIAEYNEDDLLDYDIHTIPVRLAAR